VLGLLGLTGRKGIGQLRSSLRSFAGAGEEIVKADGRILPDRFGGVGVWPADSRPAGRRSAERRRKTPRHERALLSL